MDNVIIRDASEKDIPIILGLLYDLGRPKPQKDSDVESFRKLVTKYLIDSDKKILVAVIDDVKIIGMLSMIFLSRLNRSTLETYIPETLETVSTSSSVTIGMRTKNTPNMKIIPNPTTNPKSALFIN